MTTQSKFRVPKAELSGGYGKVMSVVAKKMWGEIPDVACVMFHNKQVSKAVFGFEGKVKKFDKLDPTLSSYAQLASACWLPTWSCSATAAASSRPPCVR